MDEGFDFHWYSGKVPYFVTPGGKELYCKLRGGVPIIADGSIATPAKDHTVDGQNPALPIIRNIP